ncbi:hypothetical protein IE53DRAFT_367453, partial [Violaceomyces palustris]
MKHEQVMPEDEEMPEDVEMQQQQERMGQKDWKLKRIEKKIRKQTTVHPSHHLRSASNDPGDIPVVVPLALTPRSYQSEIYERAKEQNVIVCLDTGSGKTLVSVLLLQHMRDQELQLRRRRVSLFLVNLVPLVHQEAEVIASNSSLQVGKLYGELKDDPKLKIDTWRLP